MNSQALEGVVVQATVGKAGLFWNCHSPWGVICYSKQALLERKGKKTNHHILSVENWFTWCLDQSWHCWRESAFLSTADAIHKDTKSHQHSRAAIDGLTLWKWVTETSVKFGPFIQSNPEWERGGRSSSRSTSWGGRDRYPGSRHHGSPAWRWKDMVQGRQQLVCSRGPQTRSSTGGLWLATRDLSCQKVGAQEAAAGVKFRNTGSTQELRRGGDRQEAGGVGTPVEGSQQQSPSASAGAGWVSLQLQRVSRWPSGQGRAQQRRSPTHRWFSCHPARQEHCEVQSHLGRQVVTSFLKGWNGWFQA